MTVEHKHIIIRAGVNNPPRPDELVWMENWFRLLIEGIGMNLLMGPYVTYLNKEGNRGFTGTAIIETSHIAMHVWDEERPALMQLDVYTCGALDKDTIIRFLTSFEPQDVQYVILDRKDEIAFEKQVETE